MLKKLHNLRKEKGYTVDYMANILNLSRTFYWQVEHGDRRLSYITAINIAKVFNVKPDDVCYDEFNTDS